MSDFSSSTLRKAAALVMAAGLMLAADLFGPGEAAAQLTRKGAVSPADVSNSGPDEGAAAQLTPLGAVSPADVSNPRPDAGDIVLPMPCGLSLALRPAAVPVDGLLKDFETRLGSAEQRPHGYYDRQFVGFIASPLRLKDLPAAWRDRVKKQLADHSGGHIFLIGKYEVSVAQWEAVMGECGPLQSHSAAPKTDVAWYEAVAFTEKYMNWLLEHAPESLPAFADDPKNIGFLRLPTEAEWEYAARGGHAVSSDSLRSEPLFPLAEGTAPRDYAVFRDESSPPEKNPLRIGQRRPNPLGLYDTAGNAAEMTLDTFKLTLGGRLHGAAGGFVRKGGSFLTGTREILPGSREESAYFYRDGPTRARDLGLRLVLSAVNTPGGQRFDDLNREWAELGEGGAALVRQNLAVDPLAEIDRLAASAKTEDDRKIFEALRSLFKDYNVAVEMNNAASVKAHARSMVHAAYGIRNTSVRKNVAATDIGFIEALIKETNNDIKAAGTKADKAALTKERDRLSGQLKAMKTALGDFDVALKNQFAYYRLLIEDAMTYDQKLLAEQMAFVGRDIKGDDVHAREMRTCFGHVERDLKAMRSGQAGRIQLKNIVVPLEL